MPVPAIPRAPKGRRVVGLHWRRAASWFLVESDSPGDFRMEVSGIPLPGALVSRHSAERLNVEPVAWVRGRSCPDNTSKSRRQIGWASLVFGEGGEGRGECSMRVGFPPLILT
jgi:hypothetical protein